MEITAPDILKFGRCIPILPVEDTGAGGRKLACLHGTELPYLQPYVTSPTWENISLTYLSAGQPWLFVKSVSCTFCVAGIRLEAVYVAAIPPSSASSLVCTPVLSIIFMLLVYYLCLIFMLPWT